MKQFINKIKGLSLILLSMSLVWTGCITGNDDNAVLAELNDQFAKTPRVLNLLVDGKPQTRDTQSNWNTFIVNPGDQVVITATMSSGNGASGSTFQFVRSFSTHSNWEQPADNTSSDGKLAFGTGNHEFSFTYTVPTQDDGDPSDPDNIVDPADLVSHDIISLTFYSENDLGGQGFEEVLLEIE